MRATRLLFAAACAGLLAGCITLSAPVATELDPPRAGEHHAFRALAPGPRTAAVPAKARSFDINSALLATGQIVLRDEGDAVSFFMNLFPAEFQRWTHVGVLSIEDGKPYVYDTVMTLLPVSVPGQPPTATSGGKMRREPLEDYIANQKVVAFYAPLAGGDPAQIAAYARRQYVLGTPFDPYFDDTDATRLYCAEIVARALQELGIAVEKAPVRMNRSYVAVRDWLRIRATHLYLPAFVVNPSREVALWSPTFSRVQIDAFFEIRRELARRFDDRARLGHVFRWTGSALYFRDDVQRFIDDTEAAFAHFTGDLAAVRAEVRRRADAFFQPVN
jgi:hypothetical protein